MGGGRVGGACACHGDPGDDATVVYYCRAYDKAVRRACHAVPVGCVCFITAGPITKLCAWGEEESGGHVL